MDIGDLVAKQPFIESLWPTLVMVLTSVFSKSIVHGT